MRALSFVAIQFPHLQVVSVTFQHLLYVFFIHKAKDIKPELVGNEGEEKTCKLNYRVGEQLLSLTMNTEFILKKFEENKVLKSKEIKAEREAERSRSSSMGM